MGARTPIAGPAGKAFLTLGPVRGRVLSHGPRLEAPSGTLGHMLRFGLPALVVLALVAVILAAQGEDRESPGRPVAPPDPEPPVATPRPPRAALVRGPDDLGAAARRLARLPGVGRTALVGRGTALVVEVRARDGRLVQRVRDGFALALDVAAVEPRAWAAALPEAERAPVARLRRGEVLLSETAARLRGVGRGATLVLAAGGRLRVRGVVPDEVAQSAELLAHLRDPRAQARPRYVLALLKPTSDLSERRLKRVATDGEPTRARLLFDGDDSGDAQDGPARPAELKARFGEPAVGLPYGEDWVTLDPGFLRRHIVTRRVPLLGAVTCHRRMIPALSSAMAQLRRRGLGHLVDVAQYAGCYAPRRIQPSGTLSLHAWGLAVDLNAASNPLGGESSQDPRLVRSMERHGFYWGGDFATVPDPMHFEFRGR
jgi:D-alanyl-D-alanine carboxypeptidase